MVESASSHFLTISGAIILLMAVVIAYSVVKRYIFHAPDPYAYELSAMISLWCVALGVPALEVANRHIRMDLAIGRFPESFRKLILGVVGPVLALGYCFILAWKGFVNTFYSFSIGEQSSSPWGVPLGPIKIIVAIGYSLLCLVLVLTISKGILALKKSKK